MSKQEDQDQLIRKILMNCDGRDSQTKTGYDTKYSYAP
jgi:hypothetical protein